MLGLANTTTSFASLLFFVAIFSARRTGQVQAQIVVPGACTSKNQKFFWKQLGQDIDGTHAADGSGRAMAMSADGKTIAIGAPQHNGTQPGSSNTVLERAGQVRIWHWDDPLQTWTQMGQDLIGQQANAGWGGYFTLDMSSDGKTIVVGTTVSSDFLGFVQVWRWDDNLAAWKILGQETIKGTEFGSQWGYAGAMSGDGNIIAVGAPYYDANGRFESGQVRVLKYNAVLDQWTQLGQNIDGSRRLAHFGKNVVMSTDGKTVAVSSDFRNNQANKDEIRVWRWNEVSQLWLQLGTTLEVEKIAGPLPFSIALSSNGQTMVVGAASKNAAYTDTQGLAGRIRVYDFDANLGLWTQRGQVIQEPRLDDIIYTHSVDISADGNTFVVGAPTNDDFGENAGHARVWKWNSVRAKWVSLGQDIGGEAARDFSGSSVALSAQGKIIAVGSPLNDNLNGIDSGSVRVYQLARC